MSWRHCICCYICEIWLLVLEVLLLVMEVVVCLDVVGAGIGDVVVVA